MLSNNSHINNLMYESAIEKLSKLKNITIEESKDEIAGMTFGNYLKLLEAPSNIIPPSAKPTVQGATQSTGVAAPNTRPQQNIQPVQSARPGQPQPQGAVQSAPVQNVQANQVPPNQVPPNTQPVNNPNALPNNGQQVQGATEDINDKPVPANNQPGTNRATNQNRRHTDVKYAPYNTGSQTPIHNKQGQGGFSLDQMTQMMEDPEIARMKKLAGIAEDASCGASSAGAIASVSAPLGKVKRRNPVEESPSLEHPVAGKKTIIGATGPQASPSGKLSANLAARNKPTANRTNNGFKK